MARSERSYPPSDAQIRRWEEEAEAKRAFDAQRSVLIEASLRKLKKNGCVFGSRRSTRFWLRTNLASAHRTLARMDRVQQPYRLAKG